MPALIRGARLDTEARVLDQLHYPDHREKLSESIDSLDTDADQLSGLSSAKDSEWLMDDGQLAGVGTPNHQVEDPTRHSEPHHPTYAEYREQINDELQQLRNDAYTQGYAEGNQSGLETATREYRVRLDQLSMLIAGMRKSQENEIDGLTDIGVEIVFEAVTRILGRNYLERDGVIAMVREVIRHAKDRSRLVIRVSPADYALLDTERESLIEGWNNQQVDVIADDRVELGGCLLESPAGNLDGRLEVQLQQLRETLLNARQRRSESVFES